MPKRKRPKVVIDTNLWISFLIGKKLASLKTPLVHQDIEIVIADQIIDEIREVTQRPKLKKYFPAEKVDEFLSLINIVASKHDIKKVEPVSRDPKDDYLLALARETQADYLVTGDQDLITLKKYGRIKIITASEFEEVIRP